jgi:hypothetical protein
LRQSICCQERFHHPAIQLHKCAQQPHCCQLHQQLLLPLLRICRRICAVLVLLHAVILQTS